MLISFLGGLLYNKSKGDEMIKIMSHVHQLVPVVEYKQEVNVGDGRTTSQPMSTLHPVLLGGDQLTAARIRGTQEAKFNSVPISKRFDGLTPVIEDWHTKVNILEVCG